MLEIDKIQIYSEKKTGNKNERTECEGQGSVCRM